MIRRTVLVLTAAVLAAGCSRSAPPVAEAPAASTAGMTSAPAPSGPTIPAPLAPTAPPPSVPAAPGTSLPPTTIVSGAPPDRPCPAWTTQVLGRVTQPLTEASGLAASRRNPGLLWTHNDSGDTARVFLIDEAATIVTEVRVDGAGALDWEDVAVGPGTDGAPWVWIADVGDNFLLRPTVQLHRFREPTYGPNPPRQDVVRSEQIRVVHPGGPRDVEALLVDPDTGDAYLVSKSLSTGDGALVLRLPSASLVDGATVVGEPVAELRGLVRGSVGPTAADASPDGRELAIKTPQDTFVWVRAPGTTMAQALAGAPCEVDAGPGEALAFGLDGRSLYTLPEGEGARLRRSDRPSS